MLHAPHHRCFGIVVLLIGLFGLFVLGGAGWSLDAAVAADSNGIDEIGMFQEMDLDIGAEYRDPEAVSLSESSATEPAVTAGVVADSGVTDALFRPADPNAEIHVGGLRYLYFISLVGAALVGVRALVGWRIDIRGVALEPRERLPFDHATETDRQPTPVIEHRSQHQE